ncbi:hypothetical protein ACE3MZ_17565 [Paenibacillus sp. WLX1005]|uniref:hypothetical protein n=1 Tax=Paenibacillus sp. WLX1005 TaxID=3243766 RepID=UPI00398434E1
MRRLIKIGKWILFTPLMLIAGLLQLEDLVLLFKDQRRDQQLHNDSMYHRIEGIRN